MLTVLEYVFVLIVVGGLLFLLVSFVFGRGESLPPIPPDSVPVELPEQRPATGADIERLRLPVSLRGYRMHEVDWVLDRLAGELENRDLELERRDTEIARLRAEVERLYAEHPGEPHAESGGWAHPMPPRDAERTGAVGAAAYTVPAEELEPAEDLEPVSLAARDAERTETVGAADDLEPAEDPAPAEDMERTEESEPAEDPEPAESRRGE